MNARPKSPSYEPFLKRLQAVPCVDPFDDLSRFCGHFQKTLTQKRNPSVPCGSACCFSGAPRALLSHSSDPAASVVDHARVNDLDHQVIAGQELERVAVPAMAVRVEAPARTRDRPARESPRPMNETPDQTDSETAHDA